MIHAPYRAHSLIHLCLLRTHLQADILFCCCNTLDSQHHIWLFYQTTRPLFSRHDNRFPSRHPNTRRDRTYSLSTSSRAQPKTPAGSPRIRCYDWKRFTSNWDVVVRFHYTSVDPLDLSDLFFCGSNDWCINRLCFELPVHHGHVWAAVWCVGECCGFLTKYKMSAAFPLFTLRLFQGLRMQWAVFLLAMLCLCVTQIPCALYYWGPRIRAESRFPCGD